jgi:TolA-binding protein
VYAYYQIGDLESSERVLQEATARAQRLGAERSLAYVKILLNRVRLELWSTHYDAARKHGKEALALARELAGPRDLLVAEALSDQVTVLFWLDDLPAAEQAARQAVDLYSVLPKLHPDRLSAAGSLAEALRERRKFAEASAVLGDVLNAYRSIYGEHHRRIASTLDSLARIALEQGRLDEAAEFERQSLECEIKMGRASLADTAMTRTVLAGIQLERGAYAEAEVQLRTALAVFEKAPPADSPQRAAAEYLLGVTLLATHRPKDAQTYFQTSMSRSERNGDSDWRVARAASGLGAALYAQGRAREAEPLLVDGYRTVSTSDADERSKEAVRARVVRFYTERGQTDKLQALTNGTQRLAAQP